MRELKFKPISAWKFDNDLFDYTGRGNTAGQSAPLVPAPSLVPSSNFSLSVSQASSVSMPNQKIYKKNEEWQNFTITAWVTPSVSNPSTPTPVAVATPTDTAASVMSGIVVTGNKVEFVVRYTEGNSVVSYEFPETRKFHVAAVHKQDVNILYVDGELVGYNIVDPTYTTFLENGGTLYSGLSTGSDKVLINNLAVYDRELTQHEIAYLVDKRQFSPDVYLGLGDQRIDVGLPSRRVAIQFEYDTPDEWASGFYRNVQVNDTVRGTEVAGEWIATIPLGYGTVDNIALDWAGSGVLVETSFDAETYTPAAPNVPIVTAYDSTDKVLQVRVSFTDTASELTYLSVTVFESNLSNTYSVRDLTFTAGTVSVEDSNLLDFPRHHGTLLRSVGDKVAVGNGYVDDGTGTDTLVPVTNTTRTIEFWARGQVHVGDIAATPTTYYNGTFTTRDSNAWNLHHVTLSANVNTFSIITDSADAAVSDIVTYPTVLTADERTSIYKRYLNLIKLSHTETTPIIVSESTGTPKIYENVWTISKSG